MIRYQQRHRCHHVEICAFACVSFRSRLQNSIGFSNGRREPLISLCLCPHQYWMISFAVGVKSTRTEFTSDRTYWKGRLELGPSSLRYWLDQTWLCVLHIDAIYRPLRTTCSWRSGCWHVTLLPNQFLHYLSWILFPYWKQNLYCSA